MILNQPVVGRELSPCVIANRVMSARVWESHHQHQVRRVLQTFIFFCTALPNSPYHSCIHTWPFLIPLYTMAASESIVIIEAGINGLATVFYLARGQKLGNNIFVVEISLDIVNAASGKANGVLSDYGRIALVADHAHLSWKLHQQLATTYDGASNWGYVETLRHDLFLKNDTEELQSLYPLPEWLREREQFSQVRKGNPYNCVRVYV
jgi:hypothetical protein